MRKYESLLEKLNGETFSDDEKMARGAEARRIMDSDVFKSAMEAAELELVTSWIMSDDEKAQQRCHAAVRGLDRIWTALVRIDTDGQVAEQAADARAKELELRRR